VTHWHQLTTAETVQRLETDPQEGLSEAEASRRLEQYGQNQLTETSSRSPWQILWEQVSATMVVVLIVAALFSLALGDNEDTVAILVIVILNVVLGYSQDFRAEKAIAALKKLATPLVRVCRGGVVREITAPELVPGDIVQLEAGYLVPADCRLLESVNLRTQEAVLTGESEPVEKHLALLSGDEIPLAERINMVFMGTMVSYGRGVAVVTETGMQTRLGQIATLLQQVKPEPTPLQRRLDQLGRSLAVVALGLVGIIFMIGLLRGESAKTMFLTAVSMAVAAVPEGLPAVVTIALALGAQRMVKRHALIRKLPAVETLGSVTVICSDKTGTLTENRMTVTTLDVAGNRVNLAEVLDFSRSGESIALRPDRPPPLLQENIALTLLVAGGALCNDAVLNVAESELGGVMTLGDPTEAALVVAAARLGLWKDALEEAFPRIAEIPFDSTRKRMTTLHRLTPEEEAESSVLTDARRSLQNAVRTPCIVFTKGAVDSLIEVCNYIWVEGRIEPLDEGWRARLSRGVENLAKDGMRILGVAFRPETQPPQEGEEAGLEQNLIFIGMEGMVDPARPEVPEAVQTCKQAGIRPLMITGDHPVTARFIARKLGIADGGLLLTGTELDCLSDRELENLVESVSVYARVSPEHKLKIVEMLKQKGHIVAMTGDGVNDAPALKKADIGVAMGQCGTDVAKEAADLVLQDDNFATIVAAVEEGRVIYENTRKFIKYLMASNAGELWVMFLAPFLGMPLPLLPLQILWINLVTDGLPALALSVEPAERDTMKRPPYSPSEGIFSRGLGWHILWVGVLMGVVSLGAGFGYWRASHAEWQTMIFTTVTLAQMGHVLALRASRESVFRAGLFTNRLLIAAIALTTLSQMAVVYLPFLQGIFKTVSLTPGQLLLSLALSSTIFWGVEIEKWIFRRREERREQDEAAGSLRRV
jgi:Ca2+-transporting ATPase